LILHLNQANHSCFLDLALQKKRKMCISKQISVFGTYSWTNFCKTILID